MDRDKKSSNSEGGGVGSDTRPRSASECYKFYIFRYIGGTKRNTVSFSLYFRSSGTIICQPENEF